MENELILNKLKKDLNIMKKELKYRKLYSIYRHGVVPLGCSLIRLCSYILASTIAFNCASFCKLTPFQFEESDRKSYTVNTSTGLNYEKTLEIKDSAPVYFKHTTGWYQNEMGIYEQVITDYEINNIDFSNVEYLLSLKEEEINKLFVVKNVNVIQKQTLNEDDKLYNEEMLIIETNNNITNELTREVFEIAFFLGFSVLILKVFKKLKKLLLKTKVSTYLDGINNIYDYTVVDLEEIIKIKEENINLLLEDSNVKTYNYKMK